jgi:hypothetical protein
MAETGDPNILTRSGIVTFSGTFPLQMLILDPTKNFAKYTGQPYLALRELQYEAYSPVYTQTCTTHFKYVQMKTEDGVISLTDLANWVGALYTDESIFDASSTSCSLDFPSSRIYHPAFFGTGVSCSEDYQNNEAFKIDLSGTKLAIDYSKTTWHTSYCQGDLATPIGQGKPSVDNIGKTKVAFELTGKATSDGNYGETNACRLGKCWVPASIVESTTSMCCTTYSPNCDTPGCSGSIVLRPQSEDVCGKGKYGDNGKTNCQDCPKGYFQILPQQSQCTSCEKGKYLDEVGAYKYCEVCDIGYYSDEIGQPTCDACAAGKYFDNKILGSTRFASATTCKDCDSGKANPYPGETLCTKCPKAFIAGVAECPDGTCIAGKYTHNASSSGCRECDPGLYTDDINLDKCTACPIGWYGTPSPPFSSCEKCPTGKYGQTSGIAIKHGCSNCPIGKYLDQEGKEAISFCKNCKKGTFSNRTGNVVKSDCESCLPGKYGFKSGAVSLDDG